MVVPGCYSDILMPSLAVSESRLKTMGDQAFAVQLTHESVSSLLLHLLPCSTGFLNIPQKQFLLDFGSLLTCAMLHHSWTTLIILFYCIILNFVATFYSLIPYTGLL